MRETHILVQLNHTVRQKNNYLFGNRFKIMSANHINWGMESKMGKGSALGVLAHDG